jgi:hypothetical protein
MRALARDLAPLVAPLVAEQLAAALRGASGPRAYSSRKGMGPPGYAADTWRALSQRIGIRRGRWWVVTSEQLEAHERAERAASAVPEVPAATNWHPSHDVAPLRVVGGSR